MLGMGSMEILVILLISFLLLGPQKMISGARMLGDLLADAKRFAQQIPHIDVDNTKFGESKENTDFDVDHVGFQSDSDTKAESPIAFEPRRRKNVDPRSSDSTQSDQSTIKQVDPEDESEKSSWG